MLFVVRLESELNFSVSRSGGPGGQHVNKVNSKVTLRFDVLKSQILTQEEKETLTTRLRDKLTKDGVLILSSQEERSQLANKDAVKKKFENLMGAAFRRRKKRVATKPSKSSVRERMKKKKQHSEKKKWRQKL